MDFLVFAVAQVRPDERFAKSTCTEWYNVHNLRLNGTDSRAPPVLLATPAGYHAIILERESDASVIRILTDELRDIFPHVDIPAPVEIKRTRWHRDPFARGSYAAPPVGMDPLTAAYLAEPLGNRLFFAGEATSTTRFGYVDGAFDTGRREAERIASLCSKSGLSGDCRPPFRRPGIRMRPENDPKLRTEWFAAVKDYVL